MDFPTRCLDSEQTAACQGRRQTCSLVFRCISFITTVTALVLSDPPQNTPFGTFSLSPTTPFEVWLWLNSHFNTDSNLSARNFSQNYSGCVEQRLFSRPCVGGWLRSLYCEIKSAFMWFCLQRLVPHTPHVSFQMLQIKAGELFPPIPIMLCSWLQWLSTLQNYKREVVDMPQRPKGKNTEAKYKCSYLVLKMDPGHRPFDIPCRVG